MKTLSILLSASVLLAACSKEVKHYHSSSGTSSDGIKKNLNSGVNGVALVQEILDSETPNFALADLISRSLPREEREEARKLIMKLSPDEIDGILGRLGSNNKAIRNYYYLRGQKYQNNNNLIGNSLVNPNDFVTQSISIEDQVRVSAFTYIKDKALNEIIQTYESRVKVLSKEIAIELGSEIANSDPALAKEIEKNIADNNKERAIKMIQSARPFVEKMDNYFKTSNLSENEQYAVVGAGVIAGAIYVSVKDYKGFQNLVEEAKKIAKDVQEFKKKANEFVALVKTLDKHIDDTEKNVIAFKDGVIGMKADLKEVFDNAKTRPGKESKESMNFLYEKVVQGKDVNTKNTNSSILSKQVRINENLLKSATAVGNISENLSNILQTTNAMFNLVGVKPSRDLQKVISGAQKVAAAVSSVKSIAIGFAAGGPLGAMAAFSTSPILSSLMGGGGSQDSAMLKEINRKLDVIMENQRKMMEMQLETMKMIKDLALMVDKYHQDEMRALAELRDISLVNQEMSKSFLNKDIRSCERMIKFQLSSVWKINNFEIDSFYGINDLKIVNSRFFGNISSFEDIKRLTQSTEKNGFENCQNGISEAFSGNSALENPVRGIFSSTEDSNLYSFQRDKYKPLLGLFYSFVNTTYLDSMPLHLPTKDYHGLKEKYQFLKQAKGEDGTNEIYDMDELISVKSLERYLTQLLVLHPILEVDKDAWMQNARVVVDEYLTNANTANNQNMRSYFYLSNALKLIQSSIAQESILAGEPLLPFLVERHHGEILSEKDCTQVESEMIPTHEEYKTLCLVRDNKLLMKNYVNYFLNWKKDKYTGDLYGDYRIAYTTKNLVSLSNILNTNINPDRLRVSGEEIILNVRGSKGELVEVKLPKPDMLEGMTMVYSEYMPRLIKMQNAVIEALEKVSPYNLHLKDDNRGSDLYNAVMMSAR